MAEKKRHTCADCGKKTGELHSDGCDIERCPKCGYQLLSCDCEAIEDKDRYRVKNSIDEDFACGGK